MTTYRKDEEYAKKYAKQKHILAAINILVGLSFLFVMALFASTHLKGLLSLLTTNEYLLIALYLVVFIVIYEMLAAPINFYSSFILEHRFNLSNQTTTGWLRREGKMLLVSVTVAVPVIEAIYFFLRKYPNTWWVFAGALWVLLTVVLSRVMPTLLLPIFYKTTPIDDEILKETLLRLAGDAGIHVEGTYWIDLSKDTKKANAAIVGLGGSRRILISDTLLRTFSHKEIEAVFAHELGHHVYHHIPKLLAVTGVFGFAGFALCHYVLRTAVGFFGFQSLHDIATFPLLALVLTSFGLILLPLQNAYVRRLERACDIYSIEKTANPAAFISMMRKLAGQNLSDNEPSKLIEILFYDHPPISKRIALAEEERFK